MSRRFLVNFVDLLIYYKYIIIYYKFLNSCCYCTNVSTKVKRVRSSKLNFTCFFFTVDEFKSVLQRTVFHQHMPFDFNSTFIHLHFGKDKQRNVSYTEFTQLLHVGDILCTTVPVVYPCICTICVCVCVALTFFWHL